MFKRVFPFSTNIIKRTLLHQLLLWDKKNEFYFSAKNASGGPLRVRLNFGAGDQKFNFVEVRDTKNKAYLD